MKRRPYLVLERMRRELDSALVGMSTQEQAWLLAMIKYECAMRLTEFDAQTRLVAELDATDPLRYIEEIEQRMRQRE